MSSETRVESLTWTPKQVELMQALTSGQSRIIGFGGGIRGGKTWSCLAALIALCRIYPGSRWCVVRKDLQRIRDTVVPSFEKLRERAQGFVGRIGDTRELPFAAQCRNGSAILFRGENIDKDRELNRFHGYEVNGFLNEEADELSPRTLEKEKERAGTWIIPGGRRQPPSFILNTFNPCATWPRRVFYDPWKHQTIRPPYAFIPATAADNPYISAEQWESWQEMSDVEYQRFVESDWEMVQGAYYDTLNPQVHGIDRTDLPREIPAHWQRWGSYDWGYQHWSVMLDWCTDPDGTHYLLDALWLRKMQDDELAHAYAGWISPAAKSLIYAGHDCWAKVMARGGTGRATADVFQDAGLLLTKADIDPVNGGRTVNRLLKVHDARAGVYFVQTPGVLRVMDQLAQIVPADNDVRRPKKVDADANGEGGDDGADALRYGLSAWPLLVQEPSESWKRDVHEDRHPGFRRTAKGPTLRTRRDKVSGDEPTPHYRAIRFNTPGPTREDLD